MVYLHLQIQIPILIRIPIPFLSQYVCLSWNWNQNLTPCGMKSSEQYIYNVANFVYSLNRNRKWNHDPAM